jgi:hypothetical protein
MDSGFWLAVELWVWSMAREVGIMPLATDEFGEGSEIATSTSEAVQC